MKKNQMRPQTTLKILVTVLAVVGLVRQGARIREIYSLPNPLLAYQPDKFPGVASVFLGKTEPCSGATCATWENHSARIHPSTQGMNPRHIRSGWGYDSVWPYSFLKFDGIDDLLRIPNSVLNTVQGFTAAVWVRAASDQKPLGQIFDSRVGNFKSPLRVTQRRDGFGCEMELPETGMVAAKGGMPVKVGEWQHLVCTFDREAKILSAYLNGAVASQVAVSINNDIQSSELSLGGSLTGSANEHFFGQIASFRLEPFASPASRALQIFMDSRAPESIPKPVSESASPGRNKNGIRISSLKGKFNH